MRKLVPLFAVLLVVLVPAQALAWGAIAHQLIMRKAIERLPPALKPFFDKYEAELVLRVNDPDLWRNIPWDDDTNHFVDFGVPEYGKPPFSELPREYGAAVAKFGVNAVKRNGTLPWRVEEMAGNLRRGFEGMAKRQPYAISDVTLFAAVVAHYVQDATQPFHATDNYDGQRTGNRGIHSRFERDLVEKFGSRITYGVAAVTPMTNPRDAMFDVLIKGYGLVDRILAADKQALGSGDAYDDQYFEKFFAAVKPILEEQLTTAITATASVIVASWEQAGRPDLYTAQPRPTQRVVR